MPDLTGKSVEHYRIVAQLGEGGMATVYRARDLRLERDVAVKIIRRSAFPEEQFDGILKRFGREARTLKRLSHPNIVAILDHGEHEGMPHLILEYVSGGTLRDRLGQPVPWKDAVRLLLPVARALEYAHGQGVVHRDIKPANILLSQSGEPKLSDFGIAKLFEGQETQTLTGTGAGIGTPEYMAPEQGLGQEIDARADVYSLGIVLYEMITGHKPFSAETPLAVIIRHVNDPLPSPRRFVPDLPEKVEAVLRQALAKKTTERYQAMSEFASALEGLQGRRGRTPAAADASGTADRSPAAPGTLQTMLQDGTGVTRLQEPEAPAGNADSVPYLRSGQSRPAQRTWWPWVLGLAGLGVIVACLIGVTVLGGSWMLSASSASTATRTRTPAPAATQRPTATALRSGVMSTAVPQTSCPGAPAQRLSVGDHAHVCTQSDTVALRAGPGRSYEVLHRMLPGAEVEVIDGPECSDGWSWWRVRTTESGYVGWMAEGGDSVDPYFLCEGNP